MKRTAAILCLAAVLSSSAVSCKTETPADWKPARAGS